LTLPSLKKDGFKPMPINSLLTLLMEPPSMTLVIMLKQALLAQSPPLALPPLIFTPLLIIGVTLSLTTMKPTATSSTKSTMMPMAPPLLFLTLIFPVTPLVLTPRQLT
jgi:hypothetical protein